MEEYSEAVRVHKNIPPAHWSWFVFCFVHFWFFFGLGECEISVILKVCPEHLETHSERRTSSESGLFLPGSFFFVVYSLSKSPDPIGDRRAIYTLDIEIFFVSDFDDRHSCKIPCFIIKLSKCHMSTIFSYTDSSHFLLDAIGVLFFVRTESIKYISIDWFSSCWDTMDFITTSFVSFLHRFESPEEVCK